jgi:hypothetical protein
MAEAGGSSRIVTAIFARAPVLWAMPIIVRMTNALGAISRDSVSVIMGAHGLRAVK